MSEPPSLVELLVRQREAWQGGRRLRVEDLLERHPEFREQPDAVLDLIYNEVVLREERGEKPGFDEYLTRFPHLAEPLKLQFELDEGLSLDRTAPPVKDAQPSTVAAPPPPPA